MKWPHMLSLQRHGESAYNELDAIKKEDLTYKDFARVFDREWAEVRKDNTRILTGDFPSSQLIDLARKAIAITKLPYTDAQTPLTKEGGRLGVFFIFIQQS